MGKPLPTSRTSRAGPSWDYGDDQESLVPRGHGAGGAPGAAPSPVGPLLSGWLTLYWGVGWAGGGCLGVCRFWDNAAPPPPWGGCPLFWVGGSLSLVDRQFRSWAEAHCATWGGCRFVQTCFASGNGRRGCQFRMAILKMCKFEDPQFSMHFSVAIQTQVGTVSSKCRLDVPTRGNSCVYRLPLMSRFFTSVCT